MFVLLFFLLCWSSNFAQITRGGEVPEWYYAKYQYLSRVKIDTYDGSGQTVHPSILSVTPKFAGYSYLMAITPFPNNDDLLENPSFYGSNDGLKWDSIGTQPIVAVPNQENWDLVFNNDPEIVFNPSQDTLFLYYMTTTQRAGKGHVKNYMQRISTVDGYAWSAVDTVWGVEDTTNGITEELLSPAIIYDSSLSKYLMWSITQYTQDEPTLRLHGSLDGLSWSIIDSCNGFENSWHFDAIKEGNIYRGLMTHGYGDSVLSAGYSVDGITWYADTILTKKFSFEEGTIYKATFVKDTLMENSYRVWYGGATEGLKEWYTYHFYLSKNGANLVPLTNRSDMIYNIIK